MGTRPDGNADVGLRARRGVVHAVARHRDGEAARPDLSELRRLLVREHLGEELVKGELVGHPLHHAAVVAREHHGAFTDATMPVAMGCVECASTGVASGTARPSAWGQAMTMTVAVRSSAKLKGCSVNPSCPVSRSC